jgi:aspartate aminotransferase
MTALAPAVASSALAIPRQRIRELADIAMEMERAGRQVFKLYFGESNLPTPDFIKRAADKAIRDGFTYYTPNAGIYSLREQIAKYYARHHNVTLAAPKPLCTAALLLWCWIT